MAADRQMVIAPGKWSKPKDPPGWIQVLALRTWYLVIPLLAVWWFNTKHVIPEAQTIEQKVIAEKKAIEAERNRTLLGARSLMVRISMLNALADTFQARFDQIDALVDSVAILKDAELAETQRLEAVRDSLREMLSTTEGQALAYSDSLTGLQAKITSLQELIAERNEETTKLEADIRADRDIADRVLKPDKYRKNSALITGEGTYPNRDENIKDKR